MKIAECYCNDCRLHFKITFKKSVPPWTMICPVCGAKVSYKKIDPCENGDE